MTQWTKENENKLREDKWEREYKKAVLEGKRTQADL
jgi:hypothetical protein